MRYYNKLFIFSLTITACLSCKKVIEIKETDLLSGDVALTLVSNNEQSIIGAYSATQIEMGVLLNATLSDEVQVAEFYNAGTTHEWQYGSTDVGIRDNFTAMTPYYRVIDRVNRVLASLPDADSTRAGDNVLRGRLKGEALFLKSFSHFELFRYYAGSYDPNSLAMPYMESSPADPKTPMARIKMSEYFTKLNADLAEAKTLLPTTLPSGEPPLARATKLAASGLQARIALYTKEWASAITYSTEFINAIPLAPINSFYLIWKDSSNAEIAFKLPRTAASATNTGLTRMGSLFRGTSSVSTIGTITWRPSNELWNSYDQANDKRFNSYFIVEPKLVVTTRNPRLILKYAGGPYGATNENVADAKVFRTGEMYLIRAEARAESGAVSGANSAESDINALRTARITGYTPVTFASKQVAIDAIMLERYKELAYEGHRFWDLKRRGLPVDRLPADAPTTNAAILPAADYRFLLPIPDVEMKANSLMVQNPGYN
jgi:starch-binding outer membrane protein, SusD/RagB family